ncbi:MAG: SbmA/BacA-like family transporter [Methylotetracoccus sp.]
MLHIPINEQGWGLMLRLIRSFAASDAGHRALWLGVLLLVALLGMNGLNIANSYVGRDFFTAIAQRDLRGYVLLGLLYVAVLGASTVVAVLQRFFEERLALLWREWMTDRFVTRYMQHPTYFRMSDSVMRTAGMENPDQRIADDVRAFTSTALSFAVILLNGMFTVLAFAGVLWAISPGLFGLALAYAAIGSVMTVVLGLSLVDLNYAQLDKEASFRSGIVHVRENAESLALLQYQKRLLKRLSRGFGDLVANNGEIIRVNRNLGFFTTGYYYMAQVLPVVFVAPLFIAGEVEFGVVTQSVMAFGTMIGAFSLIITQFQSISSFAAVIQRLVNLWYAIELAQTDTVSALNLAEDDDRVAYESVTLFTPTSSEMLVRNLSVSIPHGTRVLVTSQSDAAREALFKATAGLADTGRGRVLRPCHGRIQFLPGSPYLPPGSLRTALTSDMSAKNHTDDRLDQVLVALSLESVVAVSGGLDVERDWNTLLSVRDQQTFAIARMLLIAPRFAVLDLESADLAGDMIRRMLALLEQAGVSYIVLARSKFTTAGSLADCYDAELALLPGGDWIWRELAGHATAPVNPDHLPG